MNRSVSFAVCLALAAAAATMTAATPARAANPSCAATGLAGTPVYIAGSSAVKPVLKQISNTLAGLPSPVRIIYQSVSSCTGLSDVTTAHPETATGTYWDDTGMELACDVDVAGQIPDIGVSDVYASTCDGVTVPTNFQDYPGPVQVMTIVAPPSSKETAISAEAARVVFGFGGQGTVIAPWNDPTVLFQRPDTSGTRRMIGKAIGLAIGSWHAVEKKGSTDVLAAVHNADATNPNGGLGILAADLGDTNRTGMSAIKILAFQPQGQTCAVWPDSSYPGSFDKKNVRNGTYPIWGPVHLLTKLDAPGGNIVNPNAKTLIDRLTHNGLDAASTQAMIDNEYAAHVVPQCAMTVSRTDEVGVAATMPYTAPAPCGCYYDFKATGASTCTVCTDDGPCGGGKCRYGYCEAR
jgi:ABC-type phosphate transport system substrate-binding protein